MHDFSLIVYQNLIKTFLEQKYLLMSYEKYLNLKLNTSSKKLVILRHDVDKRPIQSYNMALIENQIGVTASYYFRIVKESNQPDIIEKIRDLGHEIGYHYEDLSLANGDFNTAIREFEKNLNYFRKFYPVKTICAHGSPLSKWSNQKIWEKINYSDYGILADPALDLNYDDFFYLTDTSMKWNAEKYSVRDKVNSKSNLHFQNTFEIISATEDGDIPEKIMINTHPQRWSNSLLFNLKERVTQSLKNVIKKRLVKRNVNKKKKNTC